MPRVSTSPRSTRADGARLSRDGIVQAALELADGEGIAAVSMRRLAQRLGVDPMSLYNHIRDKSELLAELSDAVVRQIPPAPEGEEWRSRLRTLILSARATVLRHPWAPRLIVESGAPIPAALRHVDTVLGILRTGGFSLALAHHALHVLGSRILGFSQDLFDDAASAEVPPQVAAAQAAAWATTHPWVAELALAGTHDGALGGCDDDAEFTFALDLILAGLEEQRRRAS